MTGTAPGLSVDVSQPVQQGLDMWCSLCSRSAESSWKGLPISFNTVSSESAFSRKHLWALKVCSWCLLLMAASFTPDMASYPSIRWLILGPATIHLWSAPVYSVNPTAIPSPLMPALFCSWAWSMTMAEYFLLDLWTTKFPLWNSLAASGCCWSRDISSGSTGS